MKPIAPMLCGVWNPPPDDVPLKPKDGYAYEIKWDGYRLQAIKQGDDVTILYGRSARDVTPEYPEFVEAVRKIPVDCIIDGEAVVMVDGWPKFTAFQARGDLSLQQRADQLRFIVFDVMQFGTMNTMSYPYSERRKVLPRLVKPAEPYLMLGPSSSDATAMWQFVLDHNLEGLIAKPLSSRYKPGERGTWAKIKRIVTEEFWLIGYQPGGRRDDGTSFATLWVGEPWEGGLRACGVVGTGFTDETFDDLMPRMQAIRRDAPPVLVTPIKVQKPPVVWVEPTLRVRVSYQERTTDQVGLRGPASFKGLVEVGS